MNDSLIPRLSKLPGFQGYFLSDAGDGVVKSISLFDTSSQAEDSSRIAAEWTQEENLEKLVPNPPKVITRKVLAHETKAPALVWAPARRDTGKARARGPSACVRRTPSGSGHGSLSRSGASSAAGRSPLRCSVAVPASPGEVSVMTGAASLDEIAWKFGVFHQAIGM